MQMSVPLNSFQGVLECCDLCHHACGACSQWCWVSEQLTVYAVLVAVVVLANCFNTS